MLRLLNDTQITKIIFSNSSKNVYYKSYKKLIDIENISFQNKSASKFDLSLKENTTSSSFKWERIIYSDFTAWQYIFKYYLPFWK